MDFLLPETNQALAYDDGVTEPSFRARGNIGRIALIGNFLPRRCGMATFTTDIYRAFAKRFPDIAMDVWAMNDRGNRYDYPPEVTGSIDAEDPNSYRLAAREIVASEPDLVWIQHEFGIFGGPAGNYLLTLLDRLSCPVAATLHTILSEPDPAQRRVMDALVARCQTLIVMAEEGRRLLIDIYGTDPAKIVMIPHGIPDRHFAPTIDMKKELALDGRDVILTFGLLSPGKGIGTMIEALPAIIDHFPNALYVVLGATHPHTIAQAGETYRDSLKELAIRLGVSDHVRWVDAFVETESLLDYLEAADIYATPYLNPAQITSGTLSYAVGLGKPIVATPYVHARELLAEGHGRLVDFGDSKGFADAIIELLADPDGTTILRKRTYALGRTMIWPRLAEASLARFNAIRMRPPRSRPIQPPPTSIPFGAIERLSDDTGMIQHSVFSIPDRAHGYCVDDNARALILMCRATEMNKASRARLTGIYAGFVQHAWNRDTGAFRNFMGFDRRWLEAEGSGDSCGRAVWALAVAATESPDEAIRRWAADLFGEAIGSIAVRHSPRTRAFLMIAASAMLTLQPGDTSLRTLLTDLGDDLLAKLGDCRRADWRWFEGVLAYDNARLPEALLRAGLAIDRHDFVLTGLETLTWLTEQQTAKGGHFRPIGSDSFGRPHARPLRFDQQPLEAWAMIDACDAAFGATGDKYWQSAAMQAYQWYLGANDLGLAIADAATGECYDGLMPTGLNRNQGAESVLAFHISTLAINRLMVKVTRSPLLFRAGSMFQYQETEAVKSSAVVGSKLQPPAYRSDPISSGLRQPPSRMMEVGEA